MYVLYHSGETIRTGNAGVAIAVSSKMSRHVTEWCPVSDRLAYITFAAKPLDLTVVAAYAPTKDADEIAKAEFYESLQLVLSKIPRKNILIVGGDFNAKLEFDPENPSVGRFAIGPKNDNGGGWKL